MAQRKLLAPIPTPEPAKFPYSDELPEGCRLIEETAPDWGCKVKIHTDVVYCERTDREGKPYPLKLQILEPGVPQGEPVWEVEKVRKWPCIVYVQGSAFHRQNIWYALPRHMRMAEHGYVVAIVEYRPSEVAPFPAQMQDAKTAIRFMKKNAETYHIDPEHVALAGDSSGAHTALMAGFTGDEEPDTDVYSDYSASVNCIVDVYGPTVFALMNYYDSSECHWLPDAPEGMELGGLNVLDHLDLADQTVPMNYLSPDKPTPPLLLFHGGRDRLVPFNQSVILYETMKKLGKEVEFYKVANAGHGCMGFDNDTISGIVLDFLGRHI